MDKDWSRHPGKGTYRAPGARQSFEARLASWVAFKDAEKARLGRDLTEAEEADLFARRPH